MGPPASGSAPHSYYYYYYYIYYIYYISIAIKHLRAFYPLYPPYIEKQRHLPSRVGIVLTQVFFSGSSDRSPQPKTVT